jgi:hypothetical protein
VLGLRVGQAADAGDQRLGVDPHAVVLSLATRPSLPLCRCPSAMFIGAYASIANPLGLPGGLPVEVPLVVVNLLAGAPSCC